MLQVAPHDAARICFPLQMTPALLRFLLVDDEPAARAVLRHSLCEKFPEAVVEECETAVEAFAVTRQQKFTAIITRRARDTAAVPLVWEFRDRDGRVPLIMISDLHRRETARAAGANDFLRNAECGRIGSVVAGILAEDPADAMHHQSA